MNWGTPPDNWTTTTQSVEQTSADIQTYIDTLHREGKSGWVFIPARQLHAECRSTISETLFGRHLKILKVPKKKGKYHNEYALFVSAPEINVAVN